MGIGKKILSAYDNLKISQKFLVTQVLVSILPITLLLIVAFTVVNIVLRQQVDQFTNAHLEQAYSNIDSQFSTYHELLADISGDQQMIANLSELNNWGKQYQISTNYIRGRFQDLAFSDNGIIGLALVAYNGGVAYYDGVSLSNVDSFCMDFRQVHQSALYVEAMSTRDVVYGEARQITHGEYGERNVIYIAKQIVDLGDLRRGIIGAVILTVDEAYLEGIYSQRTGEWDSSFVTDPRGNILSFPQKEYIGHNVYDYAREGLSLEEAVAEFAYEIRWGSSRWPMVKALSKPEGKFIVVDVLDERTIFGVIRGMSWLIICVGIVLLGFSVLIVRYTSEGVRHSVGKIIDAMNRTNLRNFDVKVDVRGNDEFARIGSHFNTMISELQRLTVRETELLNRRKEAELQALEAQINPHFIYNTLDAINWLAIKHEEFDISQMLKNLAAILRYSIHNSNQIVKLSEDISYIRQYIFLQQKRFSHSFECMIKVDPRAKDVMVHKLLIQPLIENTLNHAFPGNSGLDEIHITVDLERDSFLRIVVDDNGVGMDEKQIAYFNQYDHEQDKSHSSIGIRNVIARIKMYYGPCSRFVISRGETGGTVITIRIPVQIEQGERERK